MAILRIAAVLMLAGSAMAQATWIVGTGGAFLDLQQAIDSPSVVAGDVLQLVPGPLPHEAFSLTKGVTIRGPAVIQGDPLYHGAYRSIISVPAGAQARLVDLDFRAPAADPLYGPAGVDCSGGLVTFDHCQIHGGVNVSSGSVSFLHCAVFGNGRRAALRLTLTPVAAVGSSFTAVGVSGYSAIEAVYGGSLHGSGLQVTGPANGSQPTAIVASGLLAPLNLWLADSTIGGSTYAIRCLGGATAQLARCTVNGGVTGSATWGAPLLGAQFAPSVPQIGMPWNLTVRGPANVPVAVVVTFGLAGPATIATHLEPVWWQGLQSFPLAAGSTGALGAFVSNQTIPALPVLRNLGVFVHTVGAAGGQHQVAPPTGGVVR